MRGQDLLVYGLDEELGDLGGPELVPGERGLASREDEEANRVGEAIDGESVYRALRVRDGHGRRLWQFTKVGSLEDG
jgi:hypothetical protein